MSFGRISWSVWHSPPDQRRWTLCLIKPEPRVTSGSAAEIKHVRVRLSWALLCHQPASTKGLGDPAGLRVVSPQHRASPPPAGALLLDEERSLHCGGQRGGAVSEEHRTLSCGGARQLCLMVGSLAGPLLFLMAVVGQARSAAASPPCALGGGPQGTLLWMWNCACLLQPPGSLFAMHSAGQNSLPVCFVTAEFVLVWIIACPLKRLAV